MRFVTMHGQSFDGSGAIVDRDVPECDVEAYKKAGYQIGSKFQIQGIRYTEADAAEQAETSFEPAVIAAEPMPEIETIPDKPKRGRKPKT